MSLLGGLDFRRCVGDTCEVGDMGGSGAIMGCVIFFFKQKTAYEMRISDWSSDVCSSDLAAGLEKGQVENQVQTIRGRFFQPRLRFASLDELKIGRASCRERVCQYV